MAKNSESQGKTESKDTIGHRESLEKEYSLWVLLNQARDAMHKAREKELRQYDISVSQAAVLFIIKAIDGQVTPSEISRWMLREPHTISAILSRMERQGLVLKEKSNGKKGYINVSMTKAGQHAFDNAQKTESFKEIVARFTPEECQQLCSLLAKLRDVSLDQTSRIRLPFP